MQLFCNVNTYLQVLGTLRVPLQINAKTTRGLPRFLNQRFAATSKQQLLMMLYAKKILTIQEISDAIRKAETDTIIALSRNK